MRQYLAVYARRLFIDIICEEIILYGNVLLSSYHLMFPVNMIVDTSPTVMLHLIYVAYIYKHYYYYVVQYPVSWIIDRCALRLLEIYRCHVLAPQLESCIVPSRSLVLDSRTVFHCIYVGLLRSLRLCAA